MIVILFIAKSIWHFPVPWWMWIIAALDSVASLNYQRNNS